MARAAAPEGKSPDAFTPSGAPDGVDLTGRERKTTDRARREAFFDAVVRPPGNDARPAAASTNAELTAALEEHDRRVVRE